MNWSDQDFDSQYKPTNTRKRKSAVIFSALGLALVLSFQNCASMKVETGELGFASKSSLPELEYAITTVYFNDDRDMNRIKRNYCSDGYNMPGIQSDEIYVDYMIETLVVESLEDVELYCKLAESMDEFVTCEEFYLQNQASVSNYIQYGEDESEDLNFIRYKYTNLENAVYEFDVFAGIDETMLTEVTKVQFQVCD